MLPFLWHGGHCTLPLTSPNGENAAQAEESFAGLHVALPVGLGLQFLRCMAVTTGFPTSRGVGFDVQASWLWHSRPYADNARLRVQKHRAPSAS